MNYLLPDYVKSIMAALKERGFEAYLVGGAVRDILLEKVPEDYDVATSARPEEVIETARNAGWGVVDELGRNFGVVMVVVGEKSVEVTSYRGESYGHDAHRPEKVWYCGELKDDLARRDFTINSIAMSIDGTFIDYFNGIEDLKDKKLRTVGLAAQRFAEDALRMFRACRFLAQLGVKGEPEVFTAIAEQLPRVGGLSLERVRTELNKLMLGNYVEMGLEALVRSGLAAQSCRQREKGKLLQVPILPELAALTGVRQNLNYHAYDVWQHTLKTLSLSEGSLEIRWALLLHDIGKGRPQVRSCDEEGNPTDHGHERLSAEMAQNILQRLRFPPKFVKRVVWLIANHMQLGFHMDKEDFVSERWVRRTALSGSFRWNSEMCEAFLQLSAVCLADLGATKAHEQEIIAMRMYIDKLLQAVRLMPVHTSDLAVSGRQVEEILHNKEVLPSLMRVLLKRVQDGSLKNTEEDLTAAVKKWRERNFIGL